MDKSTQAKQSFVASEYDAVTQRNQAASRFLLLPAELRNRIYEFVFDSATLKRDLRTSSAGQHFVESDSPRLSLVCRQVRFEVRPFQDDAIYRRLAVRTDSSHITSLVHWVGQGHCAQIVQIDMFQSLAGGIERQVRAAQLQGPYIGPWATINNNVFAELKRVVVTYSVDIADNSIEIGEALLALFGKEDLDVQFKPARYWQQPRCKRRSRLRSVH